ncbi:MAG: DsrE family protein [Sulfurovum sp.]|nr:DsrE family protein [Sulfurovum sp.]
MIKLILLFNLLAMNILHAKEYKVVYDCSSGNADYIKSRMWLVGKTIDMIEEQGDTTKVAITIHGKCAIIVSKEYDMIVPDEDVESIKKAQNYLISLSKRKNVKLITCSMSLANNAIEKKEVLPFIQIVQNSFIETIYYQNEGYALMTFK